jgi:hypothetical protein
MPNQTGPTSFTGKLASSMNNLRHGSTAKSLFLSCENPEDFFALLANSFEHYQPSFDDHAALVTRAVQDHWILLRRERIANTFEHHLCEREPDPVAWSVTEMDHLHRFDRYKTEAARAYTRSLKNLQTIQKMERDEQKWQQQLAREKEKLAADVERWQHLKDKEQPPPPPEPEPEAEETGVQQILYISYEDGLEEHYETSPTNDQLRRTISKSDRIMRTYNFVGGVPPSYKHLLTTGAVWTRGSSTAITQTYSYEEWTQLITKE